MSPAYQAKKFDRSGRLLSYWGPQGHGDGEFTGATGIAVDPQGNVYGAESWDDFVAFPTAPR